jgi:hypothetical protein
MLRASASPREPKRLQSLRAFFRLSRSVSSLRPVLLETRRDYTDIAAMAGIVWPVMEI